MLLVLLVLLAGVPIGWFLLDTSSKALGTMPVTITQLRGLAASMPGPGPSQARYETIGRRHIVGDLVAAGSGLRPVVFAIRAYELVSPGGQTITIDRGMSRSLAEAHRISDFDPVAQANVDHAVARSSVKLLLSYEPRHSGMAKMVWHGEPRASAAVTTSDDAPYAVAPGVVVIPADSIRRGERMVYARLRDGHELLFAGDVAAANVSWTEQRPPARVSTSFLAPSDREQIAAWLRTIQSLKEASPTLQIVSGHDTALPRILKHGFTDHRDRLSSVANDKRLARHPAMR